MTFEFDYFYHHVSSSNPERLTPVYLMMTIVFDVKVPTVKLAMQLRGKNRKISVSGSKERGKRCQRGRRCKEV
uniref:Ovule protein n=1 Tax=Steinernema glaseri TaxID=37863 RepID=A0A1I7Y2W4_9BILA